MSTATKIKHVLASALLFVAAVYSAVIGNWSLAVALACGSGLVGQAVIKP